MSPPEVSADNNSGLWPANEAMQSSPDRDEGAISCREEAGGGWWPPLTACQGGTCE